MSLSILQSAHAIAQNLTTPFGATGGTAPYVFSVLAAGAGGSIDGSTGVYTSPSSTYGRDTIQVTDAADDTATTTILTCSPLQLVCDVIQTAMGLANDQVYLWDQKINIPTDSRLYVVVGVLSCRPFGNRPKYVGQVDTPGVAATGGTALNGQIYPTDPGDLYLTIDDGSGNVVYTSPTTTVTPGDGLQTLTDLAATIQADTAAPVTASAAMNGDYPTLTMVYKIQSAIPNGYGVVPYYSGDPQPELGIDFSGGVDPVESFTAVQSVNIVSNISIDILSRGPDARDRKEQVLLALSSPYAQQQMELNSFYVAALSNSFVNLSSIDGAAIPYRFNINVQLQYFSTLVTSPAYYDTFSTPTVVTQP